MEGRPKFGIVEEWIVEGWNAGAAAWLVASDVNRHSAQASEARAGIQDF
jgi:hypothetical protein